MSANVVLASICIAVVIVLAMVITAVFAYFVWNGALWWMDQEASGVNKAQRPASHQDFAVARPCAPWHELPPPAQHHFNASPLQAQAVQPQHGHGHGALPPYGAAPGGGLTYRHAAARQQTDCVTIASPVRHRTAASPPFQLAASSSSTGPWREAPVPPPAPPQAPPPPAAAVVQPADLRRGYGAHLALKFGGDLAFHVDNVDVVSEVYNLDVEDLCYCFLCLEEVGEAEGGSDLKLKKWGTGSFAARIWTTALARFVKSAQRQRGALEDARVHKACAQWQYQPEHFVREVQACEAPFQRKHGRVLLEAFKDNDIRHSELVRARRVLGEHGLSAAPRRSRLALAESAAYPDKEMSLPALPSLEARAMRASSSKGQLQIDDAMDDSTAVVPKKRANVDSSTAAVAAKRRKSR
eukprot:CAMPEP_0203841294 /NCGR_PEP_ID=MMETSP0359-20131031/1303_1 /ASSEMBLY_ACC=CAM_ASM_000338 /TAXON_ID=268821 /ORGANISM="Scrippsiella Hangoei, Strain SHTV-5" /LENGTH=410 /DNA_ID=CAMNT_0050755681 /DNA_START=78 /DNA_END=1310 /DNA_ORIENTATION=+